MSSPGYPGYPVPNATYLHPQQQRQEPSYYVLPPAHHPTASNMQAWQQQQALLLQQQQLAQYASPGYQHPTAAAAPATTATTQYGPYYSQGTAAAIPSGFANGLSAVGVQYSHVSGQQVYHNTGGHTTSRSPSSEDTDSVAISSKRGGNKKNHICYENVDGRTCGVSFKRKADLIRHVQCVHHADTTKMFYCDAPRCDRNASGAHGGFTRKDHLIEHLRCYHRRDIPKRKRGKGVEEDQPESSTAIVQGNGYTGQVIPQQSYHNPSPAFPNTYPSSQYQ